MGLDLLGTTGLLVGGEWARGASLLPVRDKYTGEILAQVQEPSPDQVAAALASAAAAVREELAVPVRAAILRRAADHLASRREEIIANYVAETGFTPTDGKVELDRTLAVFELSAQEAERLAGEMVPVGGATGHENELCFTLRTPVWGGRRCHAL